MGWNYFLNTSRSNHHTSDRDWNREQQTDIDFNPTTLEPAMMETMIKCMYMCVAVYRNCFRITGTLSDLVIHCELCACAVPWPQVHRGFGSQKVWFLVHVKYCFPSFFLKNARICKGSWLCTQFGHTSMSFFLFNLKFINNAALSKAIFFAFNQSINTAAS